MRAEHAAVHVRLVEHHVLESLKHAGPPLVLGQEADV